jgi:L-lactate dehydrogenase (cytochrome)
MGSNESQMAKESDAAQPPDRQISGEELSKHATKDDCWIAISGIVYDVSRFIDRHPGGPTNLLRFAGSDGTRPYKDIGSCLLSRNLLSASMIFSMSLKNDLQDILKVRYPAPSKMA